MVVNDGQLLNEIKENKRFFLIEAISILQVPSKSPPPGPKTCQVTSLDSSTYICKSDSVAQKPACWFPHIFSNTQEPACWATARRISSMLDPRADPCSSLYSLACGRVAQYPALELLFPSLTFSSLRSSPVSRLLRLALTRWGEGSEPEKSSSVMDERKSEVDAAIRGESKYWY